MEIDEQNRIVEGHGTVQIVDNQGDFVPVQKILDLMPTYMARGGILIDGHTNRHVGKILEWKPEEKDGKPSIFLRAQIFKDYSIDDMVWDAVKQKHYTGFSFGGRSLEKHPVCQDNTCFNHIDRLEVWEWSIVPKPANKESVITSYNEVAKGDSNVLIPSMNDSGELIYVPVGNKHLPNELKKEEASKCGCKEKQNMALPEKPEEEEKADTSTPVSPPAEEAGGPMNEILDLLRSMDERLSKLEGGPAEKAELDEAPPAPEAPPGPEEEEKAEAPKTVTMPEAPASQEQKTLNKADPTTQIAAAVLGELKKQGFVQTPRPNINSQNPADQTPRPVSLGEFLMKGTGATPSPENFNVHSALANRDWGEIERLAAGRFK